MGEKLRAVYVIPAGPNDDVDDTVASVCYYAEQLFAVVVIDDRGLGPDWYAGKAGVHVVAAPNAPSGSVGGGLYVKLAAGFRYAVESFNNDVLIRLDADALLIGSGLETAALRRFRCDPTIGMLGAYRTGPTGASRDWSPARSALRGECGPRGLRNDPGRFLALWRVLLPAFRHGYTLGENALGGCYILSSPVVKTWQRKGWLRLDALKSSQACEDHLFSMLVRAAGFRIDDFSGPGDPMAVKWQGLSAHPNVLSAEPRLVIHSVRFWDQLDEATIRSFFREVRCSTTESTHA